MTRCSLPGEDIDFTDSSVQITKLEFNFANFRDTHVQQHWVLFVHNLYTSNIIKVSNRGRWDGRGM
jgi:hypothetical protein